MRMSTLTISALTLGAAGMLGASACHHRGGHGHGHDGDRHEASGHEPELGSGISTGLAVRSIANARCNREQRCDNIGAGKKWDSEGACETKTKADWADDLNKYECPKGVVQAELDECLRDIKAEDCGNPFDTIARVVSCNASDICDD